MLPSQGWAMFRCGSFLDRSATTGCTTTSSGTPTASISFSTASLILRQSNLNRHFDHDPLNHVNIFWCWIVGSHFFSVCAFVVHFLSCSLSSAQQQVIISSKVTFWLSFVWLLWLIIVGWLLIVNNLFKGYFLALVPSVAHPPSWTPRRLWKVLPHPHH